MTLIKITVLMDVEKYFLGTAKRLEGGFSELSCLRKEDFLGNEDVSAEGAVHQRRQYLARE